MSRSCHSLPAVAAVMLLAAGCASQINNTFVDSGAAQRAEMTTASAEGYQAADRPPLQDHRDWRSSEVRYHTTKVTHWPSWFEDPFVDKGNDVSDPNDRDAPDQQFASNLIDDLAGFYGPVRFFINGIGWPISAIVTLPGTVMASDGRLSKGALGYDHDAERASADTEAPFEVRFGEMTAGAPEANGGATPGSSASPSAPAHGSTAAPAPGAYEAVPAGEGRDLPVTTPAGAGQMQPTR